MGSLDLAERRLDVGRIDPVAILANVPAGVAHGLWRGSGGDALLGVGVARRWVARDPALLARYGRPRGPGAFVRIAFDPLSAGSTAVDRMWRGFAPVEVSVPEVLFRADGRVHVASTPERLPGLVDAAQALLELPTPAVAGGLAGIVDWSDDAFEETLAELLRAVEAGEAEEVVLARSVELRRMAPYDTAAVTARLARAHPQAGLFSHRPAATVDRAGPVFLGSGPVLSLGGEAGAAALADAASRPFAAAVGAPVDAALALIRRVEPASRGHYGGFQGWMNAEGEVSGALVLRGGLFDGGRARLFASARLRTDGVELTADESRDAIVAMIGHLSSEGEA